jgi:hypothetical protein
MQNMRTRIHQIGGKMNVVNTPNTQLKFTLPIAEKGQTNEVISTLTNATNG